MHRPFRVILIFVAVFVGATLLGNALGWFGEAADVAHDEFGPKAALKKYQWFVQQSTRIEEADQQVQNFRERITGVDRDYNASYGADRTKWPLDVRVQYNSAHQQATDDLTAVIAQRNSLVREYNAASRQFNWEPFNAQSNLPKQTFDELAPTH